MLGYLYGRRFGLKIAWANRKEGDSVGVDRSTETPSFLLAQAIFEKNFSHINTPAFLKPTHPSHLPAYKDGTDSVTKRRHIKFRRRGITQKKACNI